MLRLPANSPLSGLRLMLALVLLLFLPTCTDAEKNIPYFLNLQIVDEFGNPLPDVTLHTEHYVRRHLSSEYVKDTILVKDGHYTLNASAQWIDLNFSKTGYTISNRAGILRPDSLGPWFRPSADPTPVRLTMYALENSPSGAYGYFALTHTGRIGDPVIDLDLLPINYERAFTRITANTPMPNNALYASLQNAPEGPSLTLHFTRPDSGFLPFTPKPFNDPDDQMRDAPTEGYTSTYTLSPQRLAQLVSQVYSLQNSEFLYFRVNNRYGRLRLTGDRPQHSPISADTYTVSLAYHITLLPSGTTHFPVNCSCP